MRIKRIDDLHANAGWRTFSFLRVETTDGIVGWSEYTEADGSRGLTSVIKGLSDPPLSGCWGGPIFHPAIA